MGVKTFLREYRIGHHNTEKGEDMQSDNINQH